MKFLQRRKIQKERESLDPALRRMVGAGWDPVRDPKRVVARFTGVEPLEGEMLRDFFARASGCSRAEVDRYLVLLGVEGLNEEEAERKVFGGPAVLRGALHAILEAVKEFGRAAAEV